MTSDKKQLKAFVKPQTMERLKAFIAQKYSPDIKGVLSFEVETAINHHIDSQEKLLPQNNKKLEIKPLL